MKFLNQLFSTTFATTFGILALVLVANTAGAQSAAAEEGDKAEGTSKGKGKAKVSTLNNELVKVGDQNQYLYDYKQWNISTNPIGWILGSYGLSVSYAFHPNFAVRGDVSYVEGIYNVESSKGIELALTVPIYFRKMYMDYYLEPGFVYNNLEIEN